ncbi:hypothetical protein [Pseudoroseomonas cervicalis]|uniref:hypothetical protein n=1 Tax=Teichococcus cervicalis TaxID=204525 RepID=UPI0022F156F0|nr:hypothetical protein [Pseudoroseomonas cervicalis]WBV42429.1 hypothetical protein PFY06_14450 [Pseudoroseomonas cervicalis]
MRPATPRPATARPGLATLVLLGGAALLPALSGTARAQEEGWARFLPQIAPGIAACLQGVEGGVATAALPLGGNRALVRLTQGDGERLECTAALGAAGAPARRERSVPVGAAPPLPGEDAQRLSLGARCPGARPVPEAPGLFVNLPGCR